MGADALDLSAVPFLYRVFCQKVKILVVSTDKQGGEGQAFQPVQFVRFLFASVPYTTKVSTDDHVIFSGHGNLFREVLSLKPLEIAMGIACGVDHTCSPAFYMQWILYHALLDLDTASEKHRNFLG